MPAPTILGPYRLETRLGAGGMGEVFRAVDTRLKRTVAVKILTPGSSENRELRLRFQVEARAISILNHPHICTLFDVGQQDGADFLVMEYLEGETLCERLRSGPLPLEEAMRYAGQILSALDHAHRKGIIHRDLKPANIMLTGTGANRSSKLLDFGLAAVRTAPAGDDQSTEWELTGPDQIVGTPQYFAPEVLHGKPTDARSDLHAFGAVLYEMLTGRAAFAGESRAQVLAAVMRDTPPPVSATTRSVGPALDAIVARCLAKSSDERWQTASDLAASLQIGAGPAAVPTPVRIFPSWIPVAAGVLGLAIGIAGWLSGGRRLKPPPVTLMFDDVKNELREGIPSPSPDGSRIVYVASDAAGQRALWIRPLASQEAHRLAGTDGARIPFWSPDGRWIGFWAGGKIKKVDASGGAPQILGDLSQPPTTGASWGSGGEILLGLPGRQSLRRLSDTGGVVKPFLELNKARGENSYRWPVFLPDGRRFLFVARGIRQESDALYSGSLDSPTPKLLFPLDSAVQYLPRKGGTARLLYARGDSIFQQDFDGEKLTGEPVRVADGIGRTRESLGSGFTVSSDGSVLIYQTGASYLSSLHWFDRAGNSLGAVGQPADFRMPRLSPDGGSVLVARTVDASVTLDIWRVEVARGTASRLTLNPANDWFPVWSPDGRRIVFSSDRDGMARNLLYEKASLDAGSAEARLPSLELDMIPEDWSADGKWILGTAPQALWVAPASGDRKPFVYLEGPFNLARPRLSRDSRWIAYSSDETGRVEVYVRPFHGGPAGAEAKVQLSANGGNFPVWSHDGRELFYLSDGELFSVPVDSLGRGQAPRAALITKVCAGGPVAWANGLQGAPYDVSADGRKFLVNCGNDQKFVVMLNALKE